MKCPQFSQVHPEGVTALAELRGGGFLSGGAAGHIRVWTSNYGSIVSSKPKLQCTVREHKAQVTAAEVNGDSSEAITGSKDGSCIVWDIRE